MITSRKDLFYKIYDELVDNGLIEENNANFSDEYAAKREFVRTLDYIFQDYYILDQMHEIKEFQFLIGISNIL